MLRSIVALLGLVNPDVEDFVVNQAAAENRAVVFLKPHARNKSVDSFVRKRLSEHGITVKQASALDASKIDEFKLVDIHYGAIASKAMSILPKDLEVSSKAQQAFKDAFGQTWAEALKKGEVYNAKQACEFLNCTGAELDEKWSKTKRNVNLIKFGGGFYCAQIDGIFIINGFYAAMRAKYTEPGAGIAWYEVSWPEGKLSWEDFRAKVVGATDPNDAEPGSLRRDIFLQWRQMGLPSEPDVGDNGVHASASALEALAEIINWGGRPLENDSMGVALLALGYSRSEIEKMLSDSKTKNRATGRSINPFDDTEDLTSKQVLELLGAQISADLSVPTDASDSVF